LHCNNIGFGFLYIETTKRKFISFTKITAQNSSI